MKNGVENLLPETNILVAPENGWLEDFLVSVWDGGTSAFEVEVWR